MGRRRRQGSRRGGKSWIQRCPGPSVNSAVGLSAAVAAVANIKPSLVLAARLYTSARGPKDATTVTALEEGTRLWWTVRATATPL